MKSNDNIPADEMLLAKACAAAKANFMKWTSGVPFRDSTGAFAPGGPRGGAIECCALGALQLVGGVRGAGRLGDSFGTGRLDNVYAGNDRDEDWLDDHDDHGESLGWAFRCFMMQEAE